MFISPPWWDEQLSPYTVGVGAQIFAKQILHRLRYVDMTRFVLVKLFATADDRWSPLPGMAVIVHSTVTVRFPYSIVGTGVPTVRTFKRAKVTISEHRMAVDEVSLPFYFG